MDTTTSASLLDNEVMQAGLGLFVHFGIKLVIAVLILIMARLLGKWAERAIHKYKGLDDTLSGFLSGFVRYSLIAIALIIILGQFGVQTASLIAVLGAAGLAIGLALQGTLSNVAAGVMLLVLRPFRVGDFITAGGISGTVKSLGLFGTELATVDNVYIFAPNSSIWNNDIQNYSRNDHRRQDILVGISYDDDINDAISILHKIIDKEERILKSEGKEPAIMVDSMGDFSINLLVRFWCPRTEFFNLKWDLTKKFKEALDKNGITIPFPTRTVIHETQPPEDKVSSATRKKTATKKKKAV